MLREQLRDVRERPGRYEHDAGAEMLCEERHRILLDCSGPRIGQRRPVEPTLAVNVGGNRELASERPIGAPRNRHVVPAYELQHPQRVPRRLLDRLVAVDGGDADQLHLRARQCQQNGDRVVVTRVAVDEDRCGHVRSIVSRHGRRAREAPGLRALVPGRR